MFRRRRAGTVPSSSMAPQFIIREVSEANAFPYLGGHSNLSSMHVNLQSIPPPPSSLTTAARGSTTNASEEGESDDMVLGREAVHTRSVLCLRRTCCVVFLCLSTTHSSNLLHVLA